jgi:diadenosine tetraphosphate (Ap4A) HIT family hydrolase
MIRSRSRHLYFKLIAILTHLI